MQPHQQRVIDEKKELDGKASRLGNFISFNPTFETLSTEEQELLKEQCETMWEYSEILGKRIALFPNEQRYRMLTEEDVIQIGDEMLLDDCKTWERINGGPAVFEHWMIGQRYNSRFNVPMRRLVEVPSPTPETTEAQR